MKNLRYGNRNDTVYLNEVLGNMARGLLSCIFYKIIEMSSSNALNKAVNFMDLLSLIFLFCTQSPVLDQVLLECSSEVSTLAANISFPASWRSFDT